MPKLTDKEREGRRKKIQAEALQQIMDRGQFNFRLDGRDIKRLYELAGNRSKPVSAMVRDWVLERLEVEETNKNLMPAWANDLTKRLAYAETLIAFAALSASRTSTDEKTRSKLRDHIMRHGADYDSELRILLLG